MIPRRLWLAVAAVLSACSLTGFTPSVSTPAEAPVPSGHSAHLSVVSLVKGGDQFAPALRDAIRDRLLAGGVFESIATDATPTDYIVAADIVGVAPTVTVRTRLTDAATGSTITIVTVNGLQGEAESLATELAARLAGV